MTRQQLLSIFMIALRYLNHRRLATLVSIFAIGLCLLFVVGVGLVNFAVKKTAVEGTLRYPLVVGPSGSSSVQLLMSTIFHLDKPQGTIADTVYEALKQDSRVIEAYPLALADSLQNYPIIGTNTNFLKNLKTTFTGSLDLDKDIQNAVLGNEVALRLDIKIGDTFWGSHGMTGDEDADSHKELRYQVIGILGPCHGPEDTAVYTSYKAVWHIHQSHHAHDADLAEKHEQHQEAETHDMPQNHDASADLSEKHEQHQEAETHDMPQNHNAHDKYHLSSHRLTAVLVRTSNPVFTAALEREWTLYEDTQAVDTARTVRRLVSYLNKGEQLIGLFSILTLSIAILMILVTLLMSLNERRKELALMRAVGIGRFTIAMIVMLEAFSITFLGVIFGILFGHGCMWLVAPKLSNAFGFAIEPFLFTSMENWAILITLGAGQVMALIGLIWTYHLNPVEEIARD